MLSFRNYRNYGKIIPKIKLFLKQEKSEWVNNINSLVDDKTNLLK